MSAFFIHCPRVPLPSSPHVVSSVQYACFCFIVLRLAISFSFSVMPCSIDIRAVFFLSQFRIGQIARQQLFPFLSSLRAEPA
jgi:hypothetical protein